MIHNSSFNNNYKYLKFLDLISKQSNFVFSLNHFSNWSLDLIPPTPSPISTPSELIGYLPILQLYPVTTTSQSSPDSFIINDQRYLKVNSTLNDISSNKCSKLCFESTLQHNLLPNNSWRSINLYLNNKTIPNNQFFSLLPENSTLTLIYSVYSPPRTKESNVTEIIRILLPVSSSL